MTSILINKDGYVLSPYFKDANIPVDVTDEEYEQTKTMPNGCVWRYLNGSLILEELLDANTLKSRREKECFRIVDNRSPMWWNKLTDEQKVELNNWYEAWLNVTETHIIPVKPEWL